MERIKDHFMVLKKDLEYITVSEERTEAGDIHFHTFIDFGKPVHIRDREKLLIDGYGVNS